MVEKWQVTKKQMCGTEQEQQEQIKYQDKDKSTVSRQICAPLFSARSPTACKLDQWNGPCHFLDAALANYSLHPLDCPRVECNTMLCANPHHFF